MEARVCAKGSVGESRGGCGHLWELREPGWALRDSAILGLNPKTIRLLFLALSPRGPSPPRGRASSCFRHYPHPKDSALLLGLQKQQERAETELTPQPAPPPLLLLHQDWKAMTFATSVPRSHLLDTLCLKIQWQKKIQYLSQFSSGTESKRNVRNT